MGIRRALHSMLLALAPVILTARPPQGAPQPTPQSTPQAVANELLSADRSFSAAGAADEVSESIVAMLTDDAIMPLPNGKFAKGRGDILAALRSNPINAGMHADWAPVRAGVSADGLHGFTFGFMTARRGEEPPTRLKYLAYWVKTPIGWRVAAYKRALRAEGEQFRERMPPSLPAKLVAPTPDATPAHWKTLVAAEQGFSDLAHKIGLGPAFKATGRSDAMNLGGSTSPDFIYGNANIAEFVGSGRPQPVSPVVWSADTAIVASSGDLGVTFGLIKPNEPAKDGSPPAVFSFFTIWRRDLPDGVWKYIAE